MPIVTVQFDTDTHKVVALEIPETNDCDPVQQAAFSALDDRGFKVGASDIGMDDMAAIYKAMIAAAPDVQPVTLPDDVQMALEIAETIFEDAINRLVVGGDYEERALATIRAALTFAPVQYLDWGSLTETIFIKTDILHEAQGPSDAIRKTVAWFQKHGIAACLSNSAESDGQTSLTITNKG